MTNDFENIDDVRKQIYANLALMYPQRTSQDFKLVTSGTGDGCSLSDFRAELWRIKKDGPPDLIYRCGRTYASREEGIDEVLRWLERWLAGSHYVGQAALNSPITTQKSRTDLQSQIDPQAAKPLRKAYTTTQVKLDPTGFEASRKGNWQNEVAREARNTRVLMSKATKVKTDNATSLAANDDRSKSPRSNAARQISSKSKTTRLGNDDHDGGNGIKSKAEKATPPAPTNTTSPSGIAFSVPQYDPTPFERAREENRQFRRALEAQSDRNISSVRDERSSTMTLDDDRNRHQDSQEADLEPSSGHRDDDGSDTVGASSPESGDHSNEDVEMEDAQAKGDDHMSVDRQSSDTARGSAVEQDESDAESTDAIYVQSSDEDDGPYEPPAKRLRSNTNRGRASGRDPGRTGKR
ncbi:MAG: hypothetical protein M1828_001483 [Chrysothrix sp. TS-e1954]|nr:MAG: hypothetical protein M1828_001483 [Chrysothrix sp. TS-e1954]